MLPLTLSALLFNAAAERTVVRPGDSGAALSNPNMGWVFHYYDNVPENYGSRLAPSDTVDEYPGLTCVYLRIPWSYVEPAEGQFNWSVLDTPAQRWLAKGKQVAFRISVCESWYRWATPEWVQQAGAKGHNFTPGKVDEQGPFWEPDYNDPVFLEKLDHFLKAFAARYDGDPTVAFVDVGSFGVWGEGHLWASTQLKYSPETVIRHIDLYRKHFPRTLLAANDDFSFQGDETIAYAAAHGLALRDDSILVQGGKNAYFHAPMAQAFWPTVPTILESEHYGGSRDRGLWQDGSLYLQAVEEYHASYASIHWWPHEFLQECRPLIDRINLRLGYRLQPVEVSWPTTVDRNSPLPVTWSWRNAGVAPCYAGGYPALTLTDAKGGIVAVLVDDTLNVKALAVGAPGEAAAKESTRAFALPFQLRNGQYDVWVSVGNVYGTPLYELPLADGQSKRYRLGRVTVSTPGDYTVRAGALAAEGAGWKLDLVYSAHHDLPAAVRPFVHFDRSAQIAFQAQPAADVDLAPLARAGDTPLTVHFQVPPEASGKSFELWVGLYRPDRFAKPDERIAPDDDLGERRVRLGSLQVAADGAVTLVP